MILRNQESFILTRFSFYSSDKEYFQKPPFEWTANQEPTSDHYVMILDVLYVLYCYGIHRIATNGVVTQLIRTNCHGLSIQESNTL